MKFWPILVDFAMTSHLLFLNHVTMAVSFENVLISPGFLLNFILGKVTKFQRVSSKSLRVKLQLHDAIYRIRFFSDSLIHILSLSNPHNNVASIQKNRGDKSHRVIVAL